MLELWAILTPILLTDVVNPVLFAFMVYAVGTDRPLSNSISALLGHTAAYLSFGIVLALSFNIIKTGLANPKPVDFIISLTVGILLLWVAWRSRSKPSAKKEKPQVETLTPLKSFAIGAIINIIGLPFALPYFAALDQILKAELDVSSSVMVLAGYNLLYALPFLVVPLLVVVMGESSRPLLARINEKVDRVSVYLMPLMLSLVGIALIADALYYFSTGEGLF
ncbi:MAG: GAP family protein [Arenicellales bacterium]|jgi:cytochrome c biogenesis protein CcdA